MITREMAARELIEIADSKGPEPHFYKQLPDIGGCLYVDYDLGEHEDPEDEWSEQEKINFRPGCIIGEWLHTRHEVPLEDLRGCEFKHAADTMRRLNIEFEYGVGVFVNAVQTKQDAGISWQDAIVNGAEEAWDVIKCDPYK